MNSTSGPSPARSITTFPHLMGVGAAVCLLTVLVYARGMWAVALQLLLSDGLIAACWLVAAAGIGAAVLRAVGIGFRSLVLQFICAAASGLGIISLAVLVLGLCGALNRVAAIGVIAIGIALFVWWIAAAPKSRDPIQLTSWAWLWLLAAPGLGIALVCAIVPPGVLWGDEPAGYDVVEYHLQVPREWYESGRITPLTHNVYSFFPLNVEMHYLLGMHIRGGPWAGMYLAKIMHLLFVALSVLGVYGILREANAPYATLGAVAAAGAPWLILLAPIAYNEGGLLLFGTLAIGLMMLAGSSATPLRVAALAGALAGFACGAKLTAVPMVLLAVPVSSFLSGLKRNFRPIVLYLVCGSAVCSPWLIRNLLWTGNSVFPEATSVFGRGHFSQVQAERWARAHSPRADQGTLPAKLTAWWEQVGGDWRFGFFLLPLGIACAVANHQRREARYLLLLLVFLGLIWIFFTHLQSRFFVLAIPITALLIGQLQRRSAAILAAPLIGVMGVLGLIFLHFRIESRSPGLMLVGLEQMRFFTPLQNIEVNPTDQVILIGDARAFLYQIPISRLSYRTVFDVDAEMGQTSVEAWIRGIPITPGATIQVIDPNELRRFAATYWKIPPPPAELTARNEPFVIVR